MKYLTSSKTYAFNPDINNYLAELQTLYSDIYVEYLTVASQCSGKASEATATSEYDATTPSTETANRDRDE